MNDSPELRDIVYTGLQRAGIDVSAVSQRLRYEVAPGVELQTRFPHAQQPDFWLAVESIAGDGDIGLHICPYMPELRAGVLAYVMLSCPTYADGFDLFCRSSRLLSDALQLSIRRSSRDAELLLQSTDVSAPQMRHTEICMTFALVRFFRHVTDGAFKPTSVSLSCTQRAPLRHYESVFDCKVSFGAERSTIEFERALLDRMSPHHIAELWKAHRKEIDKRLLKLHRADLEERVRQVLVAYLPHRRCSFDQLAAELQIPNRTLRLRLDALGTTFSDLQEGECLRIAKRMLRRERSRLEDVAEAAGYSELSALCRAFKRKTGLTPSEYRVTRGTY
ncbi:hypothetical protein WQQ_36020 [Hydrocarboniphaga effusa AP103]|jgi:AraC-like DNA-binding protein|uniref:HTH araC/xylS-type domain-containing protein n=1 Tax=Hydrocarboniphaga effusa AP103 TaxID=1172194 RepID=I7Z9Q5_9GAMM|nr:hypothetical protein WQQ_36020 [Hydrocarboniphaga effusa AP103]